MHSAAGSAVTPWSLGVAHTISQQVVVEEAGRSWPGETDWVLGREKRKEGGVGHARGVTGSPETRWADPGRLGVVGQLQFSSYILIKV